MKIIQVFRINDKREKYSERFNVDRFSVSENGDLLLFIKEQSSNICYLSTAIAKGYWEEVTLIKE